MENKPSFFSSSYINALFLIGANGFNAAYGFLTFYYCNALGQSDYFASYISLISVVGLLAILVNFGHNFSATKYIASISEDNQQRNAFMSRVMTIKMGLLVLAFGIYLLVIATVFPEFNNGHLLTIGFLPILYEAFFPYWFFNGIGENSKTLLFNVLPKSLIVVYLVFVQPDIERALTVISLSSGLSALTAWIYIFCKKDFLFQRVKLKAVWHDIQFATLSFLTIDAIDLPLKLSKLISATFFGPANIIAFDLYEKIFRLFRLVMTSANQSLIPNIFKDRLSNYHKKYLYFFIAVSVIAIVVLTSSQGVIIGFFNINPYSNVLVFNMLLFTLPLYACTEFLGNGCLLFSVQKKNYSKFLYLFIGFFLVGFFVLKQFVQVSEALIYAYLFFELLLAIYVTYTASKLMDE